jgi:predicted CxxxxCH...CXXCH cytochrome family protein
MKRNVSTGIALAACLVTVACGGNAPTPASVTTGEMKGSYGVFYYVSVSRPVGGTIRSTDDKINCGTAGGPNNLCAPARYSWAETASLTAIPDNTGLYFQSWAGDCSGSLAAGCSLDTIASGADKWVAAVFNPADRLGHTSIPNPGQHSPLFFSFIKSLDTKVPGTPRCNTCHGVNYDGLANAPSCTACHAQTGHGNWLTDCAFCHGNPPLPSHATRSPDCKSCHPDTVNAAGAIIAGGKHMNGAVDVAGCNSCHGFPPANGTHITHFGLTPAEGTSGYGDLSILETRYPDSTTAPAKYAFGCGNCHPLDEQASHMDGTLQVELSNPSAPAGSLKALNPLGPGLGGASYTDGPNTFQGTVKDYSDGTCSNVYCHSRVEFNAPFVPDPIPDPGTGGPPFSYLPYAVTMTRVYSSPTWGGGALGCSGCHGMPPQSSNPANAAGAGDSHSWVDRYGYGNLHGFAMGRGPIACATCHFDTVRVQGGRRFSTDGNDLPIYDDVPIASFAAHVNGRPDLRFTTETIWMGSTSFTASAATGAAPQGNPGNITCSNVSCHRQQTEVKWGAPYRWYTNECNVCHLY